MEVADAARRRDPRAGGGDGADAEEAAAADRDDAAGDEATVKRFRRSGGRVALIGVAVVAGPLFAIWFVVPAGMGFGDVRLAVSVGWLVGFFFAYRIPSGS